MAVRVQVTFDCADPDRLAAFWRAALGYVTPDPPGGFATWEDFLRDAGVPEEEWNSANAIVDPDGAGPRVYFQRVPEGKTAKNRVHLDLNVGGGPATPPERRRRAIEAEASRLEDAGATRVGLMEQRDEVWIVMRDPEGNEFCLQ